MSTKFYFHSIKIENFRAFDNLTIDRLKRINIVGGFNGVGKTALLETLFLLMDRKSPIAVVKPMQFRRIDNSSKFDTSQFFHDPQIKNAHISSRLRDGEITLSLNEELPPPNMSFPVVQNGVLAGMSSSDPNQMGLSLKVLDSHRKLIEETFVFPMENGTAANVKLASEASIPRGQFVSSTIRAGAAELATAYANIVKTRRSRELVSSLQRLVPDLEGLQTLQEGSLPQIFAEVGNDLLPIQYLGDGFNNLLQTLVCIMNSRDGVIFLDEIDAAIHYSKVGEIWSIIASVADKDNCQIFATTHSKECINSAADGIRKAGRSADFQYLRMERNDKSHYVVPYNMEEVANAEDANIEIR